MSVRVCVATVCVCGYCVRVWLLCVCVATVCVCGYCVRAWLLCACVATVCVCIPLYNHGGTQ